MEKSAFPFVGTGEVVGSSGSRMGLGVIRGRLMGIDHALGKGKQEPDQLVGKNMLSGLLKVGGILIVCVSVQTVLKRRL